MSKFIGRQLAIGVGKEVSRGVGVVPSHWLHATTFSFYDRVTKAVEDGFTGGIWAGDQAFVTQKWAEGYIEFDITDKSFPLILLATLGELSSDSYMGAYKHTISLSNSSTHPSLTLHTEDPVGEMMFALAMIDKLDINITPEEIIKATATFRSKASVSGSASADFAAENKFLGRHLNLKIADDVTGLDAATKINVKSMSINIEKNTEIYPVIGTVQPNDIVNKNIVISGEFEISYDDYVWRDYMLNGDYKALRIDLVNTDKVVGTTNPSIRIDLSKVQFEGWEPSYPLNDLVTQKITFSALFDLGGQDTLVNNCYVVNDVSSY